MDATERERNYVQQTRPDLEREFAYGLKYLVGRRIRRIRHKLHRQWRREGRDRVET